MKFLLSFRVKVVLVTLFCFVRHGTCILCYDCNSAFDPRCGEEFDPFSLGVVNCSLRDPLEHIPETQSTLCRSIKMEIYGKVRVVRQCGYLSDGHMTCTRHTGNGDVFVTYCTCDTDLCNSGNTLSQVSRHKMTLAALVATLVCYLVF